MENAGSSESEDKLKVYELILARYKDHIEENEHKSVSDLRSHISPYNDFIKSLKERLFSEFRPYEYEKHFPAAARVAVDYVNGIKKVELPVSFWLGFETMDEFKVGDVIDKALLLASLLRALESPTAKVYITKTRKIYIGYEWKGEQSLINPESGSMLSGEEAQAIFTSDPIVYAFSDLYFENYGEE